MANKALPARLKPGQKPAAQAGPGAGLSIRPSVLAGAAGLFWAAVNVPPVFTAATLVIWLLGAVTAGLVARALIALAVPGATIIVKRLLGAIEQLRGTIGRP
jgi:hypothetical protein